MAANYVLIALVILGVVVVIASAFTIGDRRGFTSPAGLAALFVAALVIVLAAWAFFASDLGDGRTAGAATPIVAGRAGNAGPRPQSLGVASNGTCDAACQLAWLGRRAGVML